jgi:hypothetical protein
MAGAVDIVTWIFRLFHCNNPFEIAKVPVGHGILAGVNLLEEVTKKPRDETFDKVMESGMIQYTVRYNMGS